MFIPRSSSRLSEVEIVAQDRVSDRDLRLGGARNSRLGRLSDRQFVVFELGYYESCVPMCSTITVSSILSIVPIPTKVIQAFSTVSDSQMNQSFCKCPMVAT